MVSKKFKILEVREGKEYVFSSFSFKVNVQKYKSEKKSQGQKVSNEWIWESIAQEVHVTMDSIRNWMYGKNGPSDLESVKAIARYLNIDYHDLLKVQEEKIMSEKTNVICNMVNATETKDVIRVIYQKMSEFMDDAVDELCFDSDEEMYLIYLSVYKELIRTLHQSMIDIPPAIYDQLKDVVENELSLYLYGPECGMASIWETEEYKEFRKNNEAFSHQLYMEYKAEEFYLKMRNILKEYLPI